MESQQKSVFLKSEGDGWYARNRIADEKLDDKNKTDPLLKMLRALDKPPKTVLEIGASNGWRLALLKKEWPHTVFHGLEPSAQAVEESCEGIMLQQGTADSLPFDEGMFDLVIFGFCLYLCDRSDLFKIASEADRVLACKGLMAIYDFHTDIPYRNQYAHLDNMYSYKTDYSRLFLWNPSYRLVQHNVMLHPGCTEDTPNNRVGVCLMRKNIEQGWPDNPYA